MLRYSPPHSTILTNYATDAERAVIWLLNNNANHLIMEPGELADLAQGHKLLINNTWTKIVILNKDESYCVPDDSYIHIFIDAEIKQVVTGQWSNTHRCISHNLPPI